MDLWNSLGGMVEVELTSADPLGALDAITALQIPLHSADRPDLLHLQIRISRHDFPRIQKLCQRRGEEIRILGRFGLYYSLHSLIRRPVFLFGLVLMAFLTLWTPTRVLFVQVEGNTSVPTKMILEQAGRCGIGFGASRREVRSEKMKNMLLQAMPQLQWAGVNTKGCTAVITVRERKEIASGNAPSGVSSIVALRDGVIGEMTVLRGNALCKPGDAVQKGQVLVSGYTDCGICIQAGAAEAEIYGMTNRTLEAVFPMNYRFSEQVKPERKKYTLIIGKKRINLLKGSGISGTTCAKIYEEKYITLPGGFVLPLGIAVEQTFVRQLQVGRMENPGLILQDFARRYLPMQMLAGKICSDAEVFHDLEDLCRLNGVYSCYELIGVSRPEESLTEYE